MYSITDEGEAYLKAWAAACEKYHRLMDHPQLAYAEP
jgi:DNA-binding PadR family transcriptional regulator